jgi:hypothetical protein
MAASAQPLNTNHDGVKSNGDKNNIADTHANDTKRAPIVLPSSVPSVRPLTPLIGGTPSVISNNTAKSADNNNGSSIGPTMTTPTTIQPIAINLNLSSSHGKARLNTASSRSSSSNNTMNGHRRSSSKDGSADDGRPLPSAAEFKQRQWQRRIVRGASHLCCCYSNPIHAF